MDKFPKAIDELKAVARRSIKKDDKEHDNVAEYDTISDNIGTASNKDILAFSFDKDIDSRLREMNKCVVLKTSFGLDWLREMMGQREEPFVSAKLLACLNRSENDIIIKTNDPCFSDFIFAFMRMNNLRSRTDGEIYNKALMEFSPNGLVAEIGVPTGYVKHIPLIVDSFENFLDKTQGFYLLEKRIYIDKYQWEQDLRLLAKNMMSHLAGASLDVIPEGIIGAVLRRSDRRRRDEIKPIVMEALKDIEGRKTVQEHREWVAKMGERKRSVEIQEETKQVVPKEEIPERGQETVTLKPRTIFYKYPTIHKRRKIGEE